MGNSMSEKTTAGMVIVILLLVLGAPSYSRAETITSTIPFEHGVHETYEFTCRDCHYAGYNTCLDCHDFENTHYGLELPPTLAAPEQLEKKKSCLQCHASHPYGRAYDFVTGPLAWAAFLVFFGGLLIRSTLYIKGLDSGIDRVTYRVNTLYGIKGALKSVIYWLIPFGTRSWRTHPGITVLTVVFHAALLTAAVFLNAHNIILEDRWGFSLPVIPDHVADMLTITVIIAVILLAARRVVFKHVRILTRPSDYMILAVAAVPFVTGFLAFHEIGAYGFWLIAHIVSGEVMLMAVPFTRLSHCFLFFLSRAQIGMDYGIKRGGMKGKGKAW